MVVLGWLAAACRGLQWVHAVLRLVSWVPWGDSRRLVGLVAAWRYSATCWGLVGSCAGSQQFVENLWRLLVSRDDSRRLVATRGDSRGLVLVLFPYWVSPPWPCLGFGPRPGIRGVSCRCLASCLFLVVLLGVVSRLDYGVPAASGLGRGLLLLSWVWVCPVRVASWSCSCPGLSLDFVRSWVVLGRVTSCLLHRLRLRGRSLHCSL